MPESYNQYIKRIGEQDVVDCKACGGAGCIWEYSCGSCGEHVEPLKDGVGKKEWRKGILYEYAEYVCEHCGYTDIGLKDKFDCPECNGKGYCMR